jgi:flavin-dependent dehydrogenase
METQTESYDCGIIGGGLAGLSLAVQLADRGIRVILFEKNHYPFHKVCGEYISMESWDFLKSLGLTLDKMRLPRITHLGVSSEKGFMLSHALRPGGFGISRYSLDHYLSEIASRKGVKILQGCRVGSASRFGTDGYEIQTSEGNFTSAILCGSYGKYTPAFMEVDEKVPVNIENGNNYIGVKYHVRADLQSDRIELHNFRDGYCGISKVDRDWHCMCYLTTARNLLENGKDIRQMEEKVLYRNPFLKEYFTNSVFVSRQPLVISNVGFSKKKTESNGIFLLGDAAGSITPLCGNGMSMGMRASKILAGELVRFFDKEQSREQAAARYEAAWNLAFGKRITAGYYLQSIFGKENTTHFALKALSKMPALTEKLISLTHGDRF